MKKQYSIFLTLGVMLLVSFQSCKKEMDGLSGPVVMVNANPETWRYEVVVGGTMEVQFVAKNGKKISFIDIDFFREIWDKSLTERTIQPIEFQTIYDIPYGDTVRFHFVLPDTLSATPGEIETGFIVDRIHTQTRYKGGSDQSVTFGVDILERED